MMGINKSNGIVLTNIMNDSLFYCRVVQKMKRDIFIFKLSGIK